MPLKMYDPDHNTNKKASRAEGPQLLAKKPFNYFLALVSFFFVVSADILLVVSADILLVVSGAIVVVSGETVVLSFDSVLSPLLLQAAKDAAMIAIAKNFFIFENLRLLTIDLGLIPRHGKR